LNPNKPEIIPSPLSEKTGQAQSSLLTQILKHDACVGFDYDAGSRLTSITNANATISRSCWNDNLLKSETSTYT